MGELLPRDALGESRLVNLQRDAYDGASLGLHDPILVMTPVVRAAELVLLPGHAIGTVGVQAPVPIVGAQDLKTLDTSIAHLEIEQVSTEILRIDHLLSEPPPAPCAHDHWVN